MGKHMGRLSLLPVIMVVILVSGLSAGVSQAAPNPGPAPTAASGLTANRGGDTTTATGLPPCTKPLFGPDKDCASTSPTVDRWVEFTGTAVESCTYQMSVAWGDGTHSSNTFVDPTPGKVYLIASHIYNTQTKATYTETVTSTVTSGTCNPIPTTVFKFTHLLSAVAPSLDGQSLGGLGVSTDCQKAILEQLAADLGGSFEKIGILRGLFEPPTQSGVRSGRERIVQLVLLIADGATLWLAIDFIQKCDEHPTVGLSPLPKVFSYGASHPGKLFKPSGTVPQIPSINGIFGYQKGDLAYDSITYADPGRDAKGFGFVGIDGAGWAEENHPFSNPSFGIVGKDRVDYPYNLACGTPQEYSSWVESWIYDSQGLRSNPVEVPLLCTT